MLERISEVKGVGLFHESNGKSHACRRATLIYGNNGRGKSTLASILRSVSTGDGSLITHRKTIDGTESPTVILQFSSGHKVNFANGVWTEQRPEVLVFDADFIERNVHSGGAVNTNHRKNLLEFALGEAAVNARTAAAQAADEAKAAALSLKALEGSVAVYHPGMDLAQFESLPEIEDVDVQISTLEAQLRSAQDQQAIAAKAVPSVVPPPLLDLEHLFSVLDMSLEGIHADAERMVKEHLLKLANKDAEGWLSRGRIFEKDGHCPYCDQDILDSKLISSYKSYFNASYRDMKSKVSRLKDILSSSIPDGLIDSIEKSIQIRKEQLLAWSGQVAVEEIVFNRNEILEPFKKIREFLFELVQQKERSPADSVGSKDDLLNARVFWSNFLQPLISVNEVIKNNSILIDGYKSELAKTDISQLRQRIALFKIIKSRCEKGVVDLLEKIKLARKNLKSADLAKKVKREDLDVLMTDILDKYQVSINGLLTKFGAFFSIEGMGANFRGGTVRSEYGLLMRGKTVSLEGGTPSFATALSEGDRRTLAFAFFVASAIADANISTKTVVVDDPMCSLDLNRKHHTKAVLRNLYTSAAQLIVLAHDPYFLRDLRDTLLKLDKTMNIGAFQLVYSRNGYTDFGLLDIDKECESAYFQHHRILNDFCEGNGGEGRAIAMAIRPMLEGYLHRRFPGLVPKSLLFGQVVQLIRDATPPSPLVYAQNLVDELTSINDYVGQFHHDTNPEAEMAAVVVSELQSYVNRALVIVHRGAL